MIETNFYFENTQGDHSKFWAITIKTDPNNNPLLIRRWGKIGENGRTMQEKFSNFYSARAKRDKLVAEKEAKGYTVFYSNPHLIHKK